MEPIFNFCAETVGWLEDGIAFSDDGCPTASINNGAVFAAKNGHYLGQFDDGVFRDTLGCIVAFLQETRWYAILTTPQSGRTPPCVQSRRVPGHGPVPTASPHRAEPLLIGSSLDWERFVTGREAFWPWKTRR